MPDFGAENKSSAPPAEETAAAGTQETNANPGLDTPDLESSAVGNGGAEETDLREQFIPRARFDEVNGQVQRYRPYDDLITQIEAMGGVDALQAQIAQQAETQAASQRAARETAIEDEIAAMVEDGRLDPGISDRFAGILKDQEALRPLAEGYQRDKYQGELTRALTHLETAFPNMDQDFVRLTLETGGNGMEVAKKSHDRATAIISRYVSKKEGATGNAPTPEGRGAAPAPGTKSAVPDPSDRKAFGEYLDKIKHDSYEAKHGQ